MPRDKLIRRVRPATPFLPAPLFGGFPAFPEFDDLMARADEMMRSTFPAVPEFAAEKFPAVNLAESKEEYTLTAELPGMTAKDVDIDFSDGVLTIKGEKVREEKKEEDGKKWYMWERRFGSFQRALPFPGGINEEKIAADFKDGILTVHLPKLEEAKVKERKIPINAT